MTHKTIAITGGGSGIGLAIAKLFLEKGYQVAIMNRSAPSALKTQFAGESPLIFQGDVSQPDALTAFYQAIHKVFGRLDVVIANAGIAEQQAIEEVNEQSFDQTFNINVKGVFFTVQKALPYLKTGASIVLVSSIQANKGAGVWATYGASKAAVRSLARSFAAELGAKGIRVNCLSPGVTATPIFDKFGFEKETLAQILDGVQQATPLGKIGAPKDIANAAYFLAHDTSSFITGADLQVDGGLAQI